MLIKDGAEPTGKEADSGFSSANSGGSSTKGHDRQDVDAGCCCDSGASRRSCAEAGLACDDSLKLTYEFFYRQDNEGDTRLHAVISLGLLEATCWLIDMAPHPCLLDIRNDDGLTALHLAVMAGEALIVRRLVLSGADKQLRTTAGNTALHLACLRGDIRCAKALTDQPFIDEERRLLANRCRSARAVVDNGELELRNYNGETCLHVAASQGHSELVRHLLHLGANVGAREGLRGLTALHLAIERSHFDVVRLLVIERPFCIDTVTYAGLTTHQIANSSDRRLADNLALLQRSYNAAGNLEDMDVEKELAAFAGMRVRCLAT
ncbi:NF-kappa-B inhibitor cactus-like [Copidosoma floridanum]|uniref:NF-kappa-B inhibitor cactus-like n=1 Tax=Copidosoma floridanum TaxID=29053 RepID=UPI0006C9611D|nr:NF-kappa-B inhibitor cactus-like [Copidosoma floridanum]